jgi:hypothetical protein
VPCLRSSRRVAVRAASRTVDHSSSVFGEPPDLIGSQAEVADYLSEGLAVIDGSKELPPPLEG